MAPERSEAARERSPIPRWAKLPIAVLVVAFLVVAVASQWSKVQDADLRFEPLWLVVALVPLLAFQAGQGELAMLVLRRLGHPLPPVAGRSIYGAALLARYVPTGALVFALRITLNEREGVPKRVSLVAMVYELALALAGAGVSVVPLLPHAGEGVIAAAVIPLGGLLLLHPVPFARIVNALLRRTGNEPLAQVLPFGTVLMFVGLFTLTFWLAGLSLLATLEAITPVKASDSVAVIASFGIGFITSIVGFALPGGLGAREAGLVAGLSLTVAAPIALAAAAVSRIVQTAVELIYAGVVWLHARVERRREQRLTPSA